MTERKLQYMIKRLAAQLKAANRNFSMPDWERERIELRLQKLVQQYVTLTGQLPS